MHRPNLAMDAPPTKLMVGGELYSIHVDFRVWIQVMELIRDVLPNPGTPEEALQNAETILEIEQMVFGTVLPEASAGEVLSAVLDFAKGYPQPPINGDGGGSGAQRYSFDWDINAIIIAIRNQSGIDLSWRRSEPFHWWLFLEEFRALAGDHYILRLMEIRGYSGKDAELKRQAQKFALPKDERTVDKQVQKELDELFYNS